LILGLVNTPREIISRDYALTRIGTEPMRDQLLGVMVQHMSQQGIDEPFKVPGFEALCSASGPTILAVMKWMDEKWAIEDQELENNPIYSGVYGYLTRELGFSLEDLEVIRNSLAS
jgi:Tyrosine phosphatase family